MMAEMTMLERADGKILWECSACLAEIKDKKNFENVTSICPKCGAIITKFVSLYDDEEIDDE